MVDVMKADKNRVNVNQIFETYLSYFTFGLDLSDKLNRTGGSASYYKAFYAFLARSWHQKMIFKEFGLRSLLT